MRPFISIIFILFIIHSSCTYNNKKQKKIKKGEYTLVGNFINDSIPEGIIKFFDTKGNLHSIKKYNCGLLDGESIIYYSNGKLLSRVNYEEGKEMGFKSIYDSSGHLIYKSNFFYGQEIGSVYSYDTLKNVTEYSFNNFEDDLLYYCSYDSIGKTYTYPGDKFLIKANTSEVSVNGKDGVNVFLYIFNPPKLSLNYSIAYFNKNDSVMESFPILQSVFFYQDFYEKSTDNFKLGILLKKFDSLSKKEEIIIKYLKTSYP